MANIGYIQVVRHCNHFCEFCSNPPSPYEHSLESIKLLIDDFVQRKYYGVVLTGGEPSLHSDLPAICNYAYRQGLHVRMISNGHKLADPILVKEMKQSGLSIAHISIYSIFEHIEEEIRGVKNSIPKALQAIENLISHGIEVNINCVINKLNADHLHKNVEFFIQNFPEIKHFVWNNLDPSLGRAEMKADKFIATLSSFEDSLHKALTIAQNHHKTFRVERVPLCYMSSFAWASTETRKIIKGEERIVHFLDAKQTIRQTNWNHLYNSNCNVCSLKFICGGLFNKGNTDSLNELHPVFIDADIIIKKVLYDKQDPSYEPITLEEWHTSFNNRINTIIKDNTHQTKIIPVGKITENSLSKYKAKQRFENKKKL